MISVQTDMDRIAREATCEYIDEVGSLLALTVKENREVVESLIEGAVIHGMKAANGWALSVMETHRHLLKAREESR